MVVFTNLMTINLAVFGDVHGKQDLMYETALQWERQTKKTIDAILQVGDFETIRKQEDFEHYFAPSKYHRISDFSDYYEGFKEAPFLTIFIGGNHEAWGVLEKHREMSYLAPNTIYLGRSGQLNFKGKSIGGITGIYNENHYKTDHPKNPSYNSKYVREKDVINMKDKKLDVLLVHDWIRPISEMNIVKESNIPKSMKCGKPTPIHNLVLETKPKYVFMGHMHKSYLEAYLEDTKVFGLSQLEKNNIERSFKVIEL